jgi:4-amino-4-deoxy-L-arabinose transferase-like glycosyltransferase
MQERFSALLLHTCLAGSLLGAIATIYFSAGYTCNPLVDSLVAASVFSAALFFVYAFMTIPFQTNWVGRAIWITLGIFLTTEIILCLIPATARDELSPPIAIPPLCARTGGVIEIPVSPYSYYPMLLEILYTPWVYRGYDFVPKLVHGLFGYLTGLALYAYLSRRMNIIYGLLGFFFFISIPAVLRLSHLAEADLGVTFYATASLLGILQWREEESCRWLILAAISAGLAGAAQPNGALAAILLLLLFGLAAAEAPERRYRTVIYELSVFAIVGISPFVPWLAKNWFETGNPLFPALDSHFPTKGGLLYSESWRQIAALPLRVFFGGQDDRGRSFGEALSPILILLLPWAFKGKWLGEKKLLLGFSVLFLTCAIFFIDLRSRDMLPIVSPLVALLVYAIFNIYLRIKRPAYLFAGLLFFALVHGAYLLALLHYDFTAP